MSKSILSEYLAVLKEHVQKLDEDLKENIKDIKLRIRKELGISSILNIISEMENECNTEEEAMTYSAGAEVVHNTSVGNFQQPHQQEGI